MYETSICSFYYDFYVPGEQLTPDDLKKIKKEMDKIIRSNIPIRREEVSREEALYVLSVNILFYYNFSLIIANDIDAFYLHRMRIKASDESFKEEILSSIKFEPITIYHIGDKWWDLCAGPHLESTGKVPSNALQLQSIAGAYWRGDETKPMLQVL